MLTVAFYSCSSRQIVFVRTVSFYVFLSTMPEIVQYSCENSATIFRDRIPGHVILLGEGLCELQNFLTV